MSTCKKPIKIYDKLFNIKLPETKLQTEPSQSTHYFTIKLLNIF